jgi:hypothetical protein
MSVKLNNITTDGSPVAFGEVFAPTPIASSNTTVLATNTWLKTYLQTTIGLVLRVGAYANAFIVTGAKTIPEIIVSCSTALGITGNTTIGATTATTVNIANGATSGGQLVYMGSSQSQITPNATANTYSRYLVTNKASTSKIQNGTISVTTTGTTATFATPFSVGCVPVVVATISNSVSGIASVYQPTGVLPNVGVGLVCNNGTKNCSYIAVGF